MILPPLVFPAPAYWAESSVTKKKRFKRRLQVFVLDVSGSMEGEKLAQMKDAMVTIFDDVSEKGSLL